MINGNNKLLFENCLKAVKASIDAHYSGDPSVAVFFFSPMQTRGCTGHPSVEDHAVMAEALIPAVKKLF
jgi:hypothetical protein